MSSDHNARSGREALRVASVSAPGWETADGSIPRVGEQVHCVDGVAEVMRVLGRTGDGGRLLELRLLSRPVPPYFAASSNVLRHSAGTGEGPD